MNKLAIFSAASAAAFAASSATAAPLVSENFDTGFGVFAVESTTIARTTARPAYQICCGVNGSEAALDNPFVAFGGGNVTNRGSIFTEFVTQAGILYDLTFRAGAFGNGDTNLSYTVGGITNTLILTANNNVDATFSTYSFRFAGTGSPTTLSFSSRGPGTNVDPVLDDVSVNAAVPEPATWAMMLVGFGGLGYAMRRKANIGPRIRFA